MLSTAGLSVGVLCTSGCVCVGVLSVCVVVVWVSCQCVCFVYIRLCVWVSCQCVCCVHQVVCVGIMSVCVLCVHQVVFVWVSCQCVFQASVSRDLGGAVEGMKPTEWSHTSNWTSNADLKHTDTHNPDPHISV